MRTYHSHVWINIDAEVLEVFIVLPIEHLDAELNRLGALCRTSDSKLDHGRSLKSMLVLRSYEDLKRELTCSGLILYM